MCGTVPDLRKTRFRKELQRLMASMYNFTDIGDATTLAHPEIAKSIRHQVQIEKVANGDQPRELSLQRT